MYSACLAYADFLGMSAQQWLNTVDYKQHVCVYAISANRVNGVINDTALNELCTAKLVKLDYSRISNLSFVKSDSAHYMCYKFSLSDIATDSDTEPDVPYSYEELFNQCVLQQMSASDKMQYSYIYDAYDKSPSGVIVTYSSFSDQVVSNTTKNLMLNDFYNSNSLASTADFSRSDYYKFYVPETNIIHDTAIFELNDGDLASVSNSAHASFNTLLYCVNPSFDPSVLEDTNCPSGFGDAPFSSFNAVPISICTFSQDIILVGQNTVFEPNLNGIVSVH